MTNTEMVFRLRKRIFDEWRYKRYTWQEVHQKYGFGKFWFYKWRKRYLKYGEDGLRDKLRTSFEHPFALSQKEEELILQYVYDYPTYGPRRIADNLPFDVSGKTVWKFLKKKNLNTRRKRRIWAHDQGKPELTKKEIAIRSSKYNHIESHDPGELISLDTFWLNIKGLGKVFQYTACDTYSSYGWAKVSTPKKPSTPPSTSSKIICLRILQKVKLKESSLTKVQSSTQLVIVMKMTWLTMNLQNIL